MTDTRKKASMSQVLADIKPYITKKFMAAPCIKEQDIPAICQILLPRYKNVQLMQGLTNNKPDFRIQVQTSTESYILNTNTKKFHRPSCSSVKQMKESDKKSSSESRDALIAAGYDPCKKCNP